MVIFTGRAFSTLDSRETCHAIRIHHLVLHKLEDGKDGDVTVPVPAFPPSVYASRALPNLLTGVDADKSELPSCPVCLERLDSTVTGLVTLPCAHTFDCDCLRKWGDSRCPVCRVSHLLLSSAGKPTAQDHDEATRLTRCGMCDNAEDNWICVVCGVVGCGRYSKAHARRHWEESGHQLAMELETQRVWDYKGDNYVHRLIQTRTDGKLVELPSASSLVAAVHTRTMPLNRPIDDTPPLRDSGDSNSRTTPPTVGARDEDADHAGPSTNDMEKMSTIEAITLEYSYLLSSQLEAMRQHYESESAVQVARIASLEADNERVRGAEAAAASAEAARVAAEAAREKAEARAAKAADVTRALQTTLGSERSMAEGLQARISKMRADLDAARAARDDASGQVRALEETVRDLMFSLEAGLKIQEGGGAEAGEGGDLVVVGGKKKKKK
jgi:BRCA1-associated protein